MNLIKEIQKSESKINSKLKNNHIEIKIIESKDKYEGKIIILKDKKVIRVFALNMISCSQIDVYEKDKILERELFIHDLGAWIFNLYNNIEYLYAFYGGKLNRKVFTKEEVSKLSKGTMENMSEERKNGATVHRKELDEQPIIDGYLRPMFEKIDYGKIYIRYETQEIYDMLSA